MGALTLMIIFVGFLATGATRRRIYKAWRNRVGGRISCAVVSISILLKKYWILFLCKQFFFLVYGYHLHTPIFLDFCIWFANSIDVYIDCFLENVY